MKFLVAISLQKEFGRRNAPLEDFILPARMQRRFLVLCMSKALCRLLLGLQ